MSRFRIQPTVAVLLLALFSMPNTPRAQGQTVRAGAPHALQETAPDDGSPSKVKWDNWRGPHGGSSVAGEHFPTALDPDHLIWRTELPGKGCSTPIAFDGKIYLTVPSNAKDALICFDSQGKQVWQTLLSNQAPGKHRNGSGSNASPITDGETLFVYFKSGTLAAVSLDGAVRWQKNLTKIYGKSNLYWDHGTSPVLTKNAVVMTRMHDGDSWVAAFDKRDGREIWKVARNFKTPQEGDHGYSTPVVLNRGKHQQILVYGAEHLTLHDSETGQVNWSCGNFNPNQNKLWPSIATPVVVDDIAIVAAGRNDRRLPLLYGVKIDEDNANRSEHLWKREDTGTFVPSPATWQGNVYLLRDRGEFECLDPTTGKTIWAGRFPKHRNLFYASPLIAGEKLYALREDGVMFVADISQQNLNILSTYRLKESVIASPIPFEDHIIVRSAKHLYCFGQ